VKLWCILVLSLSVAFVPIFSFAFSISSDGKYAFHYGEYDEIEYRPAKLGTVQANHDLLSVSYHGKVFEIGKMDFSKLTATKTILGKSVNFYEIRFLESAKWSWRKRQTGTSSSVPGSDIEFSIQFFDPRLKPIIAKWETSYSDDPDNEGEDVILNQDTIWMVNDAILSGTKLTKSDLSLLNINYAKDAVTYNLEITEVDMTMRNAIQFFNYQGKSGANEFPVQCLACNLYELLKSTTHAKRIFTGESIDLP
jgi:hypothetical protein